MAKSRKQQRSAKAAAEEAAAAKKEITPPAPVVPVVVQPVVKAPEPPKKKPQKQRHVRPARVVTAETPPPLARGRSFSARTMSARIAKGLGTTPKEPGEGSKPLTKPQTSP